MFTASKQILRLNSATGNVDIPITDDYQSDAFRAAMQTSDIFTIAIGGNAHIFWNMKEGFQIKVNKDRAGEIAGLCAASPSDSKEDKLLYQAAGSVS